MSGEQGCRRKGVQEVGAAARPPCMPHPAPEGSAFLLQFLRTVAVIRPQTGALLWLQEWRIKKKQRRGGRRRQKPGRDCIPPGSPPATRFCSSSSHPTSAPLLPPIAPPAPGPSNAWWCSCAPHPKDAPSLLTALSCCPFKWWRLVFPMPLFPESEPTALLLQPCSWEAPGPSAAPDSLAFWPSVNSLPLPSPLEPWHLPRRLPLESRRHPDVQAPGHCHCSLTSSFPPSAYPWLWRALKGTDLEKGLATHSSILAWRIPWTEEPGALQSLGSQRVRDDWSNLTCTQGYRLGREKGLVFKRKTHSCPPLLGDRKHLKIADKPFK